MENIRLLNTKNSRLTIVRIKQLNLYFSYQSLVAFRIPIQHIPIVFINEHFRKYTKSTTKHINEIILANQVYTIKWKRKNEFEDMMNDILNP